MNANERDQFIIDAYRRDEQTMILVFAQWCVNHGLEAAELYARAYPRQPDNAALQEALALTAPREEAGDIDDDTVLQVLSLFDNEELAFIVTEEISARLQRPRE
ncbi:hypothetical protein [Paenibacillus radicis (ex Gao et al. 2016)]|uniref:YxiS n=1 Tax=Paenibacillus radicis (ex Gao et al. 2016) TaxID=1737354 RepID=A0A917HH50_9BACL|nr:hypothetical protein [Paenibacillus radicis (ex Gao et al. 2016)]GGG79533.1 hypothetical protein GCM10010918_40760 [Paenibacillus radicis (ex Gao et al. 2016)]